MLDLLIRGGLIVDGTGGAGYYGAIGVEGETAWVIRGDVSSIEASQIIDATDRVVSPGFIDVHAHSSLMLLAEPRHEPKVRQGITTEVIGVDGISFAPFESQEDLRRFIALNAGIEGVPTLTRQWSSVAEYLALFDEQVSINVVYLIGNSALRLGAVGWEDRPVRPDELAKMKRLLRAGMEEGAFGLSTGLDYQPGRYADTDELVELSREVAGLGGIYHTHVRYWLGDRLLDPLREAVEIGRRSSVPVHITHLHQRLGWPGNAVDLLAVIENARAEGLDVTFDAFPYVYSSSRLLIHLPIWIQTGTPEETLTRLRSPEARARMRDEIDTLGVTWHDIWLTNLNQPQNRQYESLSVAQVAAMQGKHEVDTMCDLLIDEQLGVCRVTAGGNGATLPKFVAHPLSMVGSDALLLGEYPSPRTYGTFPVILADFVREGFLSLPDAIRKMTSFAAQRLGLPDRGLLRDGMKADIVVFDPLTVSAPATRERPKQFPTGIDYVIVNGKVVVEQGAHTGRLPGRALRRGRRST